MNEAGDIMIERLNTQTTSLAMPIRCLLSSVILVGAPVCMAQIVTDGTVGPATTLSGPEMIIGAELGRTRGANLFHSFQRFDVPTGHQATFTGPEQIQNVIGRVTGGQTSNIDGTLRSTVGQADVYLINPSGIVMGPNAQVDVPAALHLSTADELRFSDGSRYSASDPANSTLTLAAPESFGFLSPQPASLIIDGSRLELKTGKTATLTAGDVTIVGTAERRATLSASNGEIRIEALGPTASEVRLDRPSPAPGTGHLSIDGAFVATLGGSGGRLTIRAGEAELRDAWLFANNTGAAEAVGGIDLVVNERLTLTAGSWITTGTGGAGQAGTLSIQAGELVADGQSRLLSGTSQGTLGAGGDMLIDVDGLLRLSDETWLSADTQGFGPAGDIHVRAGTVELLTASRISTNTFAQGRAGDLRLEAGTLRLDGTLSALSTLSSSTATGDAGRLTISVDGPTRLSNGAFIGTGSHGTGQGGVLTLKGGALELDSGSSLGSGTYGAGDAGDLIIQVGQLRLDGLLTHISSTAESGTSGRAGQIRIDVDGPAWLMNGAWILSDTEGSGDAGDLRLTARTLELTNESLISTNSWDAGRAGTLEIRTDSLRVAGESWISSQTGIGSSGEGGHVNLEVSGRAELTDNALIVSATSGTGNAGEVDVRAETLELLDGSKIMSDTFAGGDAGRVSVVSDRLRIDSERSDRLARISSTAGSGSSGEAGLVEVAVGGVLTLSGGALIESSTESLGDGGMVRVAADELRIDGLDAGFFTGISSGTGTESSGNAGAVEVRVNGLIELRRGGQIDSSTYATGNAGRVSVVAGALRINGLGSDLFTGITSGTTAKSTGNADRVRVEVEGLIELLDGGQIDSSAFGAGNAGRIHVQADSLRLDGAGESVWPTAITSRAYSDSAGDAGTVNVEVVDRLDIRHGATIDSATQSVGDAGEVRVTAGVLDIDGAGSDRFTGITSQASQDSSGQVGAVTVQAGALNLSRSGEISIGAYQTSAAETTESLPNRLQAISIEADTIHLDEGRISAQSTSRVPASPIWITADGIDLTNDSRVSTSSRQSDGGSIWIGGDILSVERSLITTEVLETLGSGGDIVLNADHVILDGGFIQANTAATGAGVRGGDISIDTRALIASEGLVEIGGAERQTFIARSGSRNIIQAAAPGGEQGTITVTSPDLDITAALVPLATAFEDPGDLLTDPCQGVTGAKASSLIERGAGGLPLIPGTPASVSFMGERLDRVRTP